MKENLKKYNIIYADPPWKYTNWRKGKGTAESHYKTIVELMVDLPRIELFARQKVDGWDSWGNEIESDIDINDYIEKEVVKCRIIGL